jgi:hypothetical protein
MTDVRTMRPRRVLGCVVVASLMLIRMAMDFSIAKTVVQTTGINKLQGIVDVVCLIQTLMVMANLIATKSVITIPTKSLPENVVVEHRTQIQMETGHPTVMTFVQKTGIKRNRECVAVGQLMKTAMGMG